MQIITSKIDINKNEVIKFEQLNIDLSDLSTTTIKQPKLQETSTIKLLNCFVTNTFIDRVCENELREEITAVVYRRIFSNKMRDKARQGNIKQHSNKKRCKRQPRQAPDKATSSGRRLRNVVAGGPPTDEQLDSRIT